MGITLRDGNVITSVISTGSQTPALTPVEEYDPLVYTLSNDGTYYIIGTGYGSIDEIKNESGTPTVGSGLKSDYGEKYTKSYLNIPATYNNLPVKAIACNALQRIANIKDIYIEDGSMTTIGRMGIAGYLYDNSSIVENIHLPNTLEYLGIGALCQNINIKAVTIPDLVTNLPERLFAFCFNLQSVYLSRKSQLQSVGNSVFYKTSIPGIFIPRYVSDIAIDDNFITKGDGYHDIRFNLSELRVSDSNTNFSDYGFNCVVNKATKEIVWGCRYTYIPDNYSATIGTSPTSIGSRAFSQVEFPSKKVFVIPNTINNIKTRAFVGATFAGGLEFSSMYTDVSGKLTAIEDFVFFLADISGTLSLPATIESLGEGLFYAANLDSVILQGVYSALPRDCFAGATIKSSIHIPNTIKSIAAQAFGQISSQFGLYYDGTIAEWQAIALDQAWRVGSPYLTQIICSDGTLDIPQEYAETWILNEDAASSASFEIENNAFIVDNQETQTYNYIDFIPGEYVEYFNSANTTDTGIDWSEWTSDISKRTLKFYLPVDLTTEFGQWLQANGTKQ